MHVRIPTPLFNTVRLWCYGCSNMVAQGHRLMVGISTPFVIELSGDKKGSSSFHRDNQLGGTVQLSISRLAPFSREQDQVVYKGIGGFGWHWRRCSFLCCPCRLLGASTVPLRDLLIVVSDNLLVPISRLLGLVCGHGCDTTTRQDMTKGKNHHQVLEQ